MAIPDRFAVHRYRQEGSRLIRDDHGTDTSGRPLYLYNDTVSRLEAIADDIGWLPTITQGEDMARAGGGAADSAGFHDRRGCVDFRTWDRTTAEMDQFIRAGSKVGAQGYRRDERHGMDPHCHVTMCGPHDKCSAGAISQMASVARGGDGLSPEGPDYELRHRVKPLVLNYDYAKHERQEDDFVMDKETREQMIDLVNNQVTKPILNRLNTLGENTRASLKHVGSELDGIGKDIDKLPADQREAINKSFGPRLRAIREAINNLAQAEEDTPS